MLKMDPQTEAGYWRARAYYAQQLEEHRSQAYEFKLAELRAENPKRSANTARSQAMAYADESARALAERQWRKIEAEFAGYEL